MDWSYRTDKDGVIEPVPGLSEAQLNMLEAKLRVTLARVQLAIMDLRLKSPGRGVSLRGAVEASVMGTDGVPPEKMLLTIPEVAKILSVGTSKVYELVRSGKIPSITLGKLRRVSRKALYDWLERGGVKEEW